MLNTGYCTITNRTKGHLPRCPFETIKNKILGKNYELGIIFLPASKQKQINLTYRGKNETTNILSFPFSKTSGEITFDLLRVKKDSSLFEMSYPEFLKYLLIHGCLHLKGFEHSSTMEEQERKYLKMFS
ncbi:MAG: rRNA maturation RNase YbeY [Candidatus Paceibacterota bacterium]|jgi:probable rRNA maturation factor